MEKELVSRFLGKYIKITVAGEVDRNRESIYRGHIDQLYEENLAFIDKYDEVIPIKYIDVIKIVPIQEVGK
jgi:hypothetical protein